MIFKFLKTINKKKGKLENTQQMYERHEYSPLITPRDDDEDDDLNNYYKYVEIDSNPDKKRVKELVVLELREVLKDFKSNGKFKGSIYKLKKAELIAEINILIDLGNVLPYIPPRPKPTTNGIKVLSLREKLKGYKKEGKFKGSIYKLKKAELIAEINKIEKIEVPKPIPQPWLNIDWEK